MKAIPITLKQANQFVAQHHRHSRPVVGAKIAVGVAVNGKLAGVAILGRPVSRRLDDGLTIEVTRCCTDGLLHACSCLYGKCLRIARELGYERAVTYTLASEPGASLRASGFAKEADVPEQDWNRPGRRRKVYEVNLFDTERKTPLGAKVRWGRKL